MNYPEKLGTLRTDWRKLAIIALKYTPTIYLVMTIIALMIVIFTRLPLDGIGVLYSTLLVTICWTTTVTCTFILFRLIHVRVTNGYCLRDFGLSCILGYAVHHFGTFRLDESFLLGCMWFNWTAGFVYGLFAFIATSQAFIDELAYARRFC